MSGPRVLLQGPYARLSGFARVNRAITDGLTRRGWTVRVFATDEPTTRVPREPLPDVYLFHGHPYDLTNAPGRVNVFYLSYDYARFVAADRWLSSRLNAHFDLLMVPSTFSRSAARRSGVRIPIVVCPYGADAQEFHLPDTARASGQPFTFLALGGATERKGTDVAVRAFAREFRGDPRVRLHIKAFSYDHLLPWMARVLARAGAARDTIVFEHGDAPSVGRYLRAADAGVFPFRGEGFGLPILECLASGTPALVSRGGGPQDYARGAHWLRTARVYRQGKHQLEPDEAHLRQLMRSAFESGPPTMRQREHQTDAVREYTWDRTVDVLERTLRDVLAGVSCHASPSANASTGLNRRRSGTRQLQAAHVFSETGRVSWKQRNSRVNRALGHHTEVRSYPWRGPRFDGHADVVVGQSDFCLEALRASTQRRPDALRLIYRESGPPESMLAIANRERALCGAPPQGVSPVSLWRHRMECRLADLVVVWSRASADRFLEAGYPEAKLRIIPPGVDRRPRARPGRARRFRALFVASDPFRKGTRTLFEAWARVQAADAELICVTSRQLFASPLLVRALMEQPTIRWQPFTSHREFQRLYDDIDCVVQPSLEDGYPAAVTDGMARGIPAIVSERSGVNDLVTHGESGLVVTAGDTDALAAALEQMIGRRADVRRMGSAALAAAEASSWAHFSEHLESTVRAHRR